jgi:hypothetical protein
MMASMTPVIYDNGIAWHATGNLIELIQPAR